MKYSIIVPVYNVEQFLETCIESILHQNFIDYEIIAVNDGSTDGSKEILEDYLKKTERLKVIHQRNKGLGGARNTGIQTATGDYLLLLDSDDYLEMNALETWVVCWSIAVKFLYAPKLTLAISTTHNAITDFLCVPTLKVRTFFSLGSLIVSVCFLFFLNIFFKSFLLFYSSCTD